MMLAMIAMISLQSMIAQGSSGTNLGHVLLLTRPKPLHLFVVALRMSHAGGAHEGTIRAVPQLLHSNPPTLPVTLITTARENYHSNFFMEAENEERHYFQAVPTEVGL
jgi:hypothetical protein